MLDLQVLEQNAHRAKEANSFSDYKEGSATEEYRRYCESAEQAAEHARKRLKEMNAPAERSEKVDYLLERYKVKKLEWLNDVYRNRASVPSIMIAGPSNFPVHKKEKQIAREKSLYEKDPEYIIEKIRGIGIDSGTIRSDDAGAVERIKAKIEKLKASPDPYGNNAAEIRRLKERLFVLAPEEFAEQQANISVNAAKTYEEILALWETGKKTVGSDGEHHYFSLPLVFTDGKRKYKEFLQIEVDESGTNMRRYSYEKRETESIPLTDGWKYGLIISRISGSGNKNVMYQYLRGLSPAAQERKAATEARAASGKAETVTINGETAEVSRDRTDMRLRLVFNGKPDDETRNMLKSNGFKWSPKNSAWQRLLNDNAEYALRRIAK